jgi:hypothetical protein
LCVGVGIDVIVRERLEGAMGGQAGGLCVLVLGCGSSEPGDESFSGCCLLGGFNGVDAVGDSVIGLHWGLEGSSEVADPGGGQGEDGKDRCLGRTRDACC